MVSKSSLLLSLAWFAVHFNKHCEANVNSTELPEGIKNQTEIDPTGKCLDHQGRHIEQLVYFVPPGEDLCKLCECNEGQAKSCKPILCPPPTNCKFFEVGTATCCEFICLDDNLKSCLVNYWLISIFLATSILLTVIALIIYKRCCSLRVYNIKSQNAADDFVIIN